MEGGADSASPQYSFTPDEQKLLMAAALEVGVKASFELHVYNFAGEYFLEKSGGPTGKRMTCPTARVRTNRWCRGVKKVLLKCPVGIKIKLVFIYVDDFRVVLTPIPLG